MQTWKPNWTLYPKAEILHLGRPSSVVKKVSTHKKHLTDFEKPRRLYMSPPYKVKATLNSKNLTTSTNIITISLISGQQKRKLSTPHI